MHLPREAVQTQLKALPERAQHKMTVAETIKEAVGLDGTSGALQIGKARYYH